MPVSHVTGGGFAFDGASFRAESSFVFDASEHHAAGALRPLLLVADAVDLVPGAADVASKMLHGMAVYLRHTSVDDPRAGLFTAFKTANQLLLSENRGRSGLRRLHLGLTCVLLRGDEVFIAQCAPSQVFVWQDDRLHAMPSLDTWSSQAISDTFSDLSYPLGFRAHVQPHVSYTRTAPGDTLAVISWPLARRLGHAGIDVDRIDPRRLLEVVVRVGAGQGAHCMHGAIYEFVDSKHMRERAGRPGRLPNSHGIGKLPIDDLADTGESIETIERTRQHERSGDHERGLVLRKNRPKTGGRGRLGFDTLDASQARLDVTDELPGIRFQEHYAVDDAPLLVLPASIARSSEPDATSEPSRPRGSLAHDSYPVAAEWRNAPVRPAASRGLLVEIFAGLLLSLSAAVVGVWQITKRDRPIHGPRDDGTLGLPHLQKWSDSYQTPRFERVRRASPRFQVNGFLKAGLLLAVLAVSIVLIVNAYNTRSDDRSAGIESRLQTISAVRTQAESATNNRSAFESLSGALVALDDLAALASSDEMLERIRDEQNALKAALEELTATEYLTSVQVMGSLPATPDGVTPRLFVGNGRIFVLGGGLFELDQTSGTLVQLLVPGDVVGGSPVGELLAAAWNDDRPLVVDSHNAFMPDPATRIWHRVPLGLLSPDGYDDITAVSVFNRNIYYLTAQTGHILKFDALDFAASPEDWAAGSSRDLLLDAVDLVVDGSIHVVLRDGSVLTFFRSALDKTVQVDAIPSLDSVTAMAVISDGDYIFVINEADGRIVVMDAEGQLINQFVTASGAPSLAGASDLVVNEVNGITYVISGDVLYAVRLTIPGR